MINGHVTVYHYDTLKLSFIIYHYDTAKTSYHTYGTKLRHCHPIVTCIVLGSRRFVYLVTRVTSRRAALMHVATGRPFTLVCRMTNYELLR